MAKIEPVPLAYNLVEPDAGTTDKPPVIILHGGAASKEDWYDIPKVVANATKRKVYAVDSRNHGENPWCDMCSFDCNVEDLLHFMDTIEAPKVILIGHSMGGITTIRTALRAPERVEKAVIEDMTVCKMNPQTSEAVANEIGLASKALEAMPPGLDEKDANLFILDFMRKALAPEGKQIAVFDEKCPSIPLKKTEDGRYSFQFNVEAIQNAFRNETESESCVCGKYEGPACFIYGKSSPFEIYKDEAEIKQLFPKAELVGIEDATHNVHNDCPAHFKAALLEFLLKD